MLTLFLGLASAKKPVYKNDTRENPEGAGELFGYPEAQSNIESRQNARVRFAEYLNDHQLQCFVI